LESWIAICDSVDTRGVSIIGTNVAQSVAGLTQAERIEAREKRPEQATSARQVRRDEQDTVSVQNETADAVRNLKGNDQEDAREDRQEHPQNAAPGPARPRIDLEG
jgi:hypothetical protein